MTEQDALERSRANADMSPLEKAGAAMQAARLVGSGLTQLVMSMPTRIRSGDQAADDYISENIYQPTIPKATEYVGDFGEMMEQLETKYKIPPIMPELLPFQEMTGPAMRQISRTAPRAAGAIGLGGLQMADQGFAGGGLLKGIKAIKKSATNAERSMPARGALRFADEPVGGPSVIKEKGGNWMGGNVAGNVDRALNQLKTPTVAGDTPAQRIPKHEALLQDPTLNQDQIDRVLYQLEATKGEAAVDQWIANNVGNYIKKDMATPTDPVRLMFERRAQEIEAQFQTDMSRAQRTRARAEEEADPRRRANLTRQAAQQEEQAKFDRDFANEHITHLPKEDDGIDRDTWTNLRKNRREAGFDPEGVAQSDPAKRWEGISDDVIEVTPASRIQGQREKYLQLQAAEQAHGNMWNQISDEYVDQFKKTVAERGAGLTDDQIVRIAESTPIDEKARATGKEDEFKKLQSNLFNARQSSSAGYLEVGEENPWIAKLDPESKVYSAYIGDLGIDHVIDVIRQDVRDGRIRPEQLNKLSMDQAIQRTAEFNMEQAKKMREAVIKNTEGFPIHKEYADEGYKWVELSTPKMPDVLPEGWSEPVQKGNALQTVSPKGKIVLGFNLPDLVKNIYRRHPETPGNPEKALEDALKYEGDTMGHCVGNYCPDVIQGKSRIYSLRDKRGEPHVTVEVKPNEHLDYNKWFDKQPEEVQNRIAKRRLDDKNHDIYEGPEYLADRAALLPKITQIKGKGNAKPKEEYLPFVQDFVRGGEWSDVGDFKNTGLVKYEGKIMTQAEADDMLYQQLNADKPGITDDLGLTTPPEDGMKRGGSVHISDNPDTMMMELGDQHFALGGLSKASKAIAKAAKPNLVIKSKPGIIVSDLIDEEPDIAKRLGAEARAKRQAAIEAEGQRKQLAAQTQPSVGYRKTTEQSPDPLVGTRYVNDPAYGLNPNEPFDISKFKGGSGLVLPWDSQSRNVKTTQLSGMDLPNQIFDVTHGGIPYAFDTAHVNKGVAGASGLDIAKRVKTRADTAVKEGIGRGGTGELLHFPITMGYRAEDYALPYSEFSFDIINHKLMTGELTQKEADELTKMVRNFEPPKYKGKKPFENFAGFTNPEGLDQIYTGQGLKVPSGELRKAIADRIIWQKGSQEKLGFNAEDLMNATTYEPLRGVDKGYIGSTVMRNSPGGMRLSPSTGKFPYDTDFSGEHLGRLDDLVDAEALFYRTLNPIKRELITRENLKPYNKESLRNAAIGAIEKRNEGISQPIDQQFLDDYADYLNELKKPHEYRKGGAITVKPKRDGQKFKPGKKPDQILKHGQAMPRGKDPEVDISQIVPQMSAGGKLSKVALEAIQRMKAMRPEIAAKSSLEQKALTENTAKYARDIQPFSMTDEEVAAEIKRLESKGMAGGGEVNADDLILEERPL
jgi:hypothetical protein